MQVTISSVQFWQRKEDQINSFLSVRDINIAYLEKLLLRSIRLLGLIPHITRLSPIFTHHAAKTILNLPLRK